MTKLNPTLLSEMSLKTRFLFLEVYLDDLQDVYSEVMETLQGNTVRLPQLRLRSVSPLPSASRPLSSPTPHPHPRAPAHPASTPPFRR